MKRFLIVFIIIILLPACAMADDYNDYLNAFDLSSFESLDVDTKDALEYLGLSDFDYNSVTSLSASALIDYVGKVISGAYDKPLKSMTGIIAIILLSNIFKSFMSDSENSEITDIVTNIILSIYIIKSVSYTFSFSASTIRLCANFVFAFFPAFLMICTTSGNAAAALSANTGMLMLSQGIAFLSDTVFLPLVQCFAALGICSSLSEQSDFGGIINSLKGLITKALSIISAVFVSILTLKTTVASRADALGLRSIRFAINSVVPVIGGSISDGLLSIQAYSGLIKTSVGTVGIIAVILIFLPSVIKIIFWRLALGLCGITADLTENNSQGKVISIFKDTLTLITVILILIMVTTIISIGILISVRNV